MDLYRTSFSSLNKREYAISPIANWVYKQELNVFSKFFQILPSMSTEFG